MKGNLLEQQSKPPVVLVKTWVHLINSSESDEVINRASSMLLNSFCNIQEAVEFCRQHDIKMNNEKRLEDAVSGRGNWNN